MTTDYDRQKTVELKIDKILKLIFFCKGTKNVSKFDEEFYFTKRLSDFVQTLTFLDKVFIKNMLQIQQNQTTFNKIKFCPKNVLLIILFFFLNIKVSKYQNFHPSFSEQNFIIFSIVRFC